MYLNLNQGVTFSIALCRLLAPMLEYTISRPLLKPPFQFCVALGQTGERERQCPENNIQASYSGVQKALEYSKTVEEQ